MVRISQRLKISVENLVGNHLILSSLWPISSRFVHET